MLLLCCVISAVPILSKNFLGMLDAFTYSGVVWGCITDHKQAVPHSVCAERSLRARSTGQDINLFIPYIVADNCDIKIIY